MNGWRNVKKWIGIAESIIGGLLHTTSKKQHEPALRSDAINESYSVIGKICMKSGAS
jgi:hypothetical protein